jgi:hypothetical protein
MRLPLRSKVVKRCREGHEMSLEWRSCPRCTGKVAVTETRDILDATIVHGVPAAPRIAAKSAPAFLARLTYENGPRAGETIDLLAGRAKLGKAPKPDGDARLVTLEDAYLSRDHAAVTSGAGGVVLVDLGSTNGTFVNGRKVERAILADGDELRLGQISFRVTLGSPA